MRKNKCAKADVLWEIAVVCEHVTKQYHNTGEQRKWLKVVLTNTFIFRMSASAYYFNVVYVYVYL